MDDQGTTIGLPRCPFERASMTVLLQNLRGQGRIEAEQQDSDSGKQATIPGSQLQNL